MKRFTLSVERTEVARIDICGLDAYRAAIAIQGLGKEFEVNSFVARDMIEKDHSPFVYWTNGVRTLAHGKIGDIVSIYEEQYVTKKEKQP